MQACGFILLVVFYSSFCDSGLKALGSLRLEKGYRDYGLELKIHVATLFYVKTFQVMMLTIQTQLFKLVSSVYK